MRDSHMYALLVAFSHAFVQCPCDLHFSFYFFFPSFLFFRIFFFFPMICKTPNRERNKLQDDEILTSRDRFLNNTVHYSTITQKIAIMDSNLKKDKDEEVLIDSPLHGIYIPSFFILLGTLFFGWDKLIYGAGFVAILFAFRLVNLKFFKNRKKLVPDQFRQFELAEQTIISKDSAIYRFKLHNEDDSIKIPLGHHVACVFTDEELKDPLSETENKEEKESKEEKDTKNKEYVRYYTPISSKYDKGFFDLLVKSYPDGKVSKKFAVLNPHQNVKFKGPVGRFPSEQFLTPDHCDTKEKKVILIAGGTGITPFLRIIIESPMSMNFKLLYYSKTPKDILLKDELDEVNKFKDTFEVEYLTGLLTEENVTENIESSIDRSSSVLICGPPEFKKKANNIVKDLGFSETFVF